jgi:hypothetical protein
MNPLQQKIHDLLVGPEEHFNDAIVASYETEMGYVNVSEVHHTVEKIARTLLEWATSSSTPDQISLTPLPSEEGRKPDPVFHISGEPLDVPHIEIDVYRLSATRTTFSKKSNECLVRSINITAHTRYSYEGWYASRPSPVKNRTVTSCITLTYQSPTPEQLQSPDFYYALLIHALRVLILHPSLKDFAPFNCRMFNAKVTSAELMDWYSKPASGIGKYIWVVPNTLALASHITNHRSFVLREDKAKAVKVANIADLLYQTIGATLQSDKPDFYSTTYQGLDILSKNNSLEVYGQNVASLEINLAHISPYVWEVSLDGTGTRRGWLAAGIMDFRGIKA